MARVVLLALGGTLAMTGEHVVVPTLDGDQLLAGLPSFEAEGISVEASSLMTKPGAALRLEDVVRVASEIEAAARQGADGVVVTQGTDTIEETAFLLDLLVEPTVAVVVTGGMRAASAVGADGPANVSAAIRAADSPASRCAGVMVAMGDELHAARFVRKVHAWRADAFASPMSGPMGAVVEGRTRLLWRPPALVRLPIDRRLLTVATVRTWSPGLAEEPPPASGGIEPDGVVLAGFGSGHVSPEVADAAIDVAARCPVVLASRTGTGQSLRSTYGFHGSETSLLDAGLIPAGWLDAVKARAALLVALACGEGPGGARLRFAELRESAYVTDDAA